MSAAPPILLLIFNRPDTTARVFAQIKKVQPKQLFVAADGPRVDRVGEQELCAAVRKIITDGIDWDCELKILFRDTNLGCGLAVSGAITWFFQHVKEGIILEDDTMPDISFFEYCEKLLEYYKDDERIMHISGSNYSNKNIKESYFFSKLPFVWGWATWRRAWVKYNFDYKYIAPLEKNKIISKAFNNDQIQKHWSDFFSDFHLNPVSFTWDFQWFLAIWDNDGLVVQPQKNLVQNIGFNSDATHTKETDHHLAGIEGQTITNIILRKEKYLVNEELQYENFKTYFNPPPEKSAIRKIKDSLNFKHKIGKLLYKISKWYQPPADQVEHREFLKCEFIDSIMGDHVSISPIYKIHHSNIGDYSYIAQNAIISETTIGKFCSIGPNLICGWGIHPVRKLTTSPMFYSTGRQNGITLSAKNKIIERQPIRIGNDVFIGMNVTILDGVTIEDGAVIGAGSVVSKNIPAYAIAVGGPIKIIGYRFENEQIEKLLAIKWWNWQPKELSEVEKYFDDVDGFIEKYIKEINEIKITIGLLKKS